ncbi:reverse transcriptase domain-containing protein [Tanacetum coccineum]
MLERLCGNEYCCFLNGFSGFFQIPIVPEYQEKATFTCPYGTFAYRRMPFGLCNALAIFQRCRTAISHDMVEDFMEVFMDRFSVFGNSFDCCLANLDIMLARCEETNLVLNWENFYFMVNEGIVLGHKISRADHSALKHLFSKQDAKPRLIRWVLLLQVFDIEIKDKKGGENLAADHLSRLKNPELSTFTKEEIADEFLDEHLMALKTEINNDEPCCSLAGLSVRVWVGDGRFVPWSLEMWKDFCVCWSWLGGGDGRGSEFGDLEMIISARDYWSRWVGNLCQKLFHGLKENSFRRFEAKRIKFEQIDSNIEAVA